MLFSHVYHFDVKELGKQIINLEKLWVPENLDHWIGHDRNLVVRTAPFAVLDRVTKFPTQQKKSIC